MPADILLQEERSVRPTGDAEAPIRAEGFNHLHINVRDLERSIRFYEEAFGLRLDFKADVSLVFMTPQAGGHSLALHLVGLDEPVGMAGGIQHFGFKLNASDHDRVIEQVERAGGRLVSRGKHDQKYPYAYVCDPDGYVIEL
ncbi:MAG TPA: VOC family protein [Caulobacteraceae bacterium]|nr:VOC family protein [Caulobacteraceae bacterium]